MKLTVISLVLNELCHEKTCFFAFMRKQRLRSAYIGTIPHLSKSKISSLLRSSVAVQPDLCQTSSETQKSKFCCDTAQNKSPVTQQQHSHGDPIASKKNAECQGARSTTAATHAVGLHRMLIDDAHFEHAQNKRCCSAF